MTLSSRFLLLLLLWPLTAVLVWYSVTTWQESKQFLGQAKVVQGQVVRVERTQPNSESWVPVVSYGVEGMTFTVRGRVGASANSYTTGETIDVAYRQQEPGDGRLISWVEFYFLPSLVTAAAGLLALIGLWQAITLFSLVAGRGRLSRSGERVAAEVIRFEIAKDYKNSGKQPWIIVCHWQDPTSGQRLEFKSEPVWRDPAQFLNIGASIEVVLDRKNPAKHFVDIEPYRQLAYAQTS